MRRFRDLPIGRKVTLLILLACAVATVLASAGVVAYEITTVRPRVLRDLGAQADLMRANTLAALAFGDSAAAAENLATLRARREIEAAVLYDGSGGRFAGYVRGTGGERFAAPAAAPPDGLEIRGTSIRLARLVEAEGERLGTLVLWYELPSLWRRLPQYGIMFGVVLLALLTVSVLLAWLLRTSLSAPLGALGDAARSVTERRDYGLRVAKHGDDELGRLTDAFNTMLAAVESRDDAIRDQAERLREAMEAARMASWVYDPADATIRWGGAEERLFGAQAPRDPSLAAFLEQVHPEDRASVRNALRAAAAAAASGGGTGVVELDLRVAGGEERPAAWFTLRGRAVAGPAGPRLVGLAQDVTERRRLEDQLMQSQKMEAVGQLAGGIAHDFNNLLTAILGYARFAARRLPPDTPAGRDVLEIQRAGERAATLTQQLLAYSRRQMLQPTVLDLNELVAGLAALLGRLIGEHIDLVLRLQPGIGAIRADRSRLEQVILNLAVNARDAMPEGGRLRIETSSVQLGADRPDALAQLEPGPYLRLTVSDSGQGMAPETLAHIFEPFFTTKEVGKGTGLGLAMVYGTVSQSGGGITVRSAPGAGTTFDVYLPRIEAGHAADDDEEADVPRGRERVLVVEDDPSVLELAARSLESQGYEVLTADSAGAAERLLDEAGGGAAAIDLLVTDVVMPERGGRVLADELRLRAPDLRVLYMSGYTDDAVLAHGVEERFVAFLQKPFSPEALARRVREVLDAPAADGRGPRR